MIQWILKVFSKFNYCHCPMSHTVSYFCAFALCLECFLLSTISWVNFQSLCKIRARVAFSLSLVLSSCPTSSPTAEEAGLCFGSPLPWIHFCMLIRITCLQCWPLLVPTWKATSLYWSGGTIPYAKQGSGLLSVILEIQSSQFRDLPFDIQTSSLALLCLAFSVPVDDSTILCNPEKLWVQFCMCCLQMTSVFCLHLGQNASSKVPLSVSASSYKILAVVTG